MTSAPPVSAEAKPFLRWAGGKRWLLQHLKPWLSEFEFNNYHEPFLGGGSVFFGVAPTGMSYLSDLNVELIQTYQQVTATPQAVATQLSRHTNDHQHYYSVRSQRPKDPVERAARFIYLNHTSFNGIYRVNLKGQYNVPFGNRTSLKPPGANELEAVSASLRSAKLIAQDFKSALSRVDLGDLVFLDPPYTVAHNNNGFVKYNQKLFSFDDQRALSDAVAEIRMKGAFYILTNAAHSSISELFDSDDHKVSLTRRSSVAGKLAARGQATEFMYTNLPSS